MIQGKILCASRPRPLGDGSISTWSAASAVTIQPLATMNLQRCLMVVFAVCLLLAIHASNSSEDDDDYYYDGFPGLPHGPHVPEPATAPFGQVTVGEAQLAESAEHLWRAAVFSLFLGGSLSLINGLAKYDWLQLSARVRIGLDISHCLLWMFIFTMWVVSLWVELQLGHYNFP